jgi:hypothetical protein
MKARVIILLSLAALAYGVYKFGRPVTFCVCLLTCAWTYLIISKITKP